MAPRNRIGTMTVEVSRGADFYLIEFKDNLEIKQRIVSEMFDMSDENKRKEIVAELGEAIRYIFEKKFWPEDSILVMEKISNGK